MICPNCQKEIDDDSLFCTYCGTDVSNVSDFYEMEEESSQAGIKKKQSKYLLIMLVLVVIGIGIGLFSVGIEKQYYSGYDAVVRTVQEMAEKGKFSLAVVDSDPYRVSVCIDGPGVETQGVSLYGDMIITCNRYTYDFDNDCFLDSQLGYAEGYISEYEREDSLLEREDIKDDFPLEALEKYADDCFDAMNCYTLTYYLYVFPEPANMLERIYERNHFGNSPTGKRIEVCKNTYYFTDDGFVENESDCYPYGGIDSAWENNQLYYAEYDNYSGEVKINYDMVIRSR